MPRITTEMPDVLASVPVERITDLDIREELRAGREPFRLIMSAKRSLPPGGVLRLRATFEPMPLYQVMAKQGLDRWTERLGDEDWRVWFFEAKPPEVAPFGTQAMGETTPAGEYDDLVVLDVRGMEPPEPMVRTLAALERLPAGRTLLQINTRIPRFLLPKLEEHGFIYDVREQNQELVRIFIRRRNEE